MMVVRIRILIGTTIMRIATVDLARRSDWLVSSHDYGETDKGAGHCIGKVNIGALMFFRQQHKFGCKFALTDFNIEAVL